MRHEHHRRNGVRRLLLHSRALPLPPRFVGDLLNRREEILEDAPRAEVDFGIDLHAWDEPQLPALAFEVAAV